VPNASTTDARPAAAVGAAAAARGGWVLLALLLMVGFGLRRAAQPSPARLLSRSGGLPGGTDPSAPPASSTASDPWTRLAYRLQVNQEDERARLASTLHDELGGLLTAAKLDVARIRSRLPADADAEAADAELRLAHLAAMLDESIALKRRLIEDLRPSMLAHLGLVAALEQLVADFSRRHGSPPLQVMLQPVALTAAAELTVYRLVQRALVHAALQASMGCMHLQLVCRGRQGVLTVHGEDPGFEPLPLIGEGAHDVQALRCRVEGEGGLFQLGAMPGAGHRLVVLLPVRPDGEP